MSTIVESQGVRTRMRNSQPLAAALRVVVAGLIVALTASAGHARPAYFEQFKEFYSIPDGSNLDACGVCHFRWYGTGARNPFGSTVEQQLYLGKTVMQSLMDVEGMDPDGDGYTSGDEIITFMTLPGYNCANYTDAIDPPLGYDTYITPGVATCHEPLDIRVSPTSVGMILYNGQTRTSSVTVFNNGSDDPLNITSYALLPGAPASLSVSGPATPLSIPVGQSITLDITFSPATDTFSSTALRISSNDPDEAQYDLPVTVFAGDNPTASNEERAPCFAAITKAMSKYAKSHLRIWNQCYLEELAGRACDGGDRDLKLARAVEKFETAVGGSKDEACAGAGLTGTTLGFPSSCGEGCESISTTTISGVAQCLECEQDLAMKGMLADGIGTTPPDLPSNVISDAEAYSCQQRIVRSMQKTMLKMYSALTECELDEVVMGSEGGTCQTDIAAELAELREPLDATLDKCTSTTGLLGCRFDDMPDAQCLGLSAEDLAAALTNTTFGLYE